MVGQSLILKSFLNSVGVQPLAFLNARLKVVRLEKPHCIATSVMGREESAISLSAAFILLLLIYWMYDILLYFLKIREK